MSTIYLHVGTEKTGTTTIQHMLAANRAELLRQGYLYPTSPGDINHVKLALFFSSLPNADLFGGFSSNNSESFVQNFRSTFLGNLDAELKAEPTCNYIFSNEHCSSRLTTALELQEMRRILLQYSADIRIIIYLRRQDEALLSLYSTHIKNGRPDNISEFAQNLPRWFDYAELLALWAEVFGPRSLTVRIFDPDQLKKGKLEDDFFECVGISDTSKLRCVLRENVSLDRARLEFMRRLNKHMGVLGNDEARSARGNLIRLLEDQSTGPRLSLSAEQARGILGAYDDSNRFVARNFLGREDGILFRASLSVRPETLAIDLENEMMKTAAELWVQKQAEVTKLRTRVATLERRVIELAGDGNATTTAGLR